MRGNEVSAQASSFAAVVVCGKGTVNVVCISGCQEHRMAWIVMVGVGVGADAAAAVATDSALTSVVFATNLRTCTRSS